MAESPQTFLEHLYAAYAPGGHGNDFTYPEAAAIVDESLMALLHRDQIRSGGEVGARDFDPVCQCQDWGPFTIVSIRTHTLGPARASGDVIFRNGPKNAVQETSFDLVARDGRWKIHDLSYRGTPSLRARIRDYRY